MGEVLLKVQHVGNAHAGGLMYGTEGSWPYVWYDRAVDLNRHVWEKGQHAQ